MAALLQKSWLNQKRAKLTNCCQILIPVALIILLFLAQLVVNGILAKATAGVTLSTAVNPPSLTTFSLYYTDPYVASNCQGIFYFQV